LEEARQALVFGVRPKRSFRQAATKYLLENQHKRSIEDEAMHLRQLDPFIGNTPIESVHMGALQKFIEARQRQGVKCKTINLALGVVRHILNLAAHEWRDQHNLSWLAIAPKIKLLKVLDARAPYPLSWDEQARLFQELPLHLGRMALFKVNSGCRDEEVCALQWAWEVGVPELGTSDSCRSRQKWRDAVGGAQSCGADGDRVDARGSSTIRVHVSGEADRHDEQHGLAKCTRASRVGAGSGPRFEAHVRSTSSCRRRVL
jgi:hypothetical protein